jgi:hypothetical protein
MTIETKVENVLVWVLVTHTGNEAFCRPPALSLEGGDSSFIKGADRLAQSTSNAIGRVPLVRGTISGVGLWGTDEVLSTGDAVNMRTFATREHNILHNSGSADKAILWWFTRAFLGALWGCRHWGGSTCVDFSLPFLTIRGDVHGLILAILLLLFRFGFCFFLEDFLH